MSVQVTIVRPFNSDSTIFYRTLTEINKSAPCNSLCHCNSREYDPVCGVDELSYFSPCHAGCTIRKMDEGREVEACYTLKFLKVAVNTQISFSLFLKEPPIKHPINKHVNAPTLASTCFFWLCYIIFLNCM